jgi:outer membrane lipoprotein-sorting protein
MLDVELRSQYRRLPMKLCLAIAVALLASVSAHAQAAKPCEELKSEIAAKLEAKGVKSYTLEVVANGKEGDGKVVGSCDGGTKKIVYRRGAAAAEAAPAEKPKS